MRDLSELGIFYVSKVIERPPPTEEELAAFEAAMGVLLPGDYKQFLRRQNGGCPRVGFLAVDGDGFEIEAFYHLSLNPKEPYSMAAASSWPSEVLSRRVIAVAGDGSGDQLIIDAAEDPAAVKWWRHDYDEPPRVVAASFTELLDRLTASPERD